MQTMAEDLRADVDEILRDSLYQDAEIVEGVRYAEIIGFDSDDEALGLVLAKILYSADDLLMDVICGVETGWRSNLRPSLNGDS